MKANRPAKGNHDSLYFSARLRAKLEEMPTARTTIINAPAGYGKTTAAREFLDKRLPKGAALHWLACAEEPASTARDRFCRTIQKIDVEAGSELLSMGLPYAEMRGVIATIIMELECAKEGS